TGQIVGAGTASTHYKNGGGKAVDFTRLGKTGLTGADAASIKFISLLDPVMPDGTNVGQANCRKGAGTGLALKNLNQFTDACHHLHIDVGTTDEPLKLG
ncbi:MAG: hypothetical protein JWR57_1020, partial [Mycetocola sp.]|nr:hypothetical protein [Mycetocola sp.]